MNSVNCWWVEVFNSEGCHHAQIIYLMIHVNHLLFCSKHQVKLYLKYWISIFNDKSCALVVLVHVAGWYLLYSVLKSLIQLLWTRGIQCDVPLLDFVTKWSDFLHGHIKILTISINRNLSLRTDSSGFLLPPKWCTQPTYTMPYAW